MRMVEVELYRVERLIFGQVLFLVESLRGRGVLAFSHGPFMIVSSLRPNLSRICLDLGGTQREYDRQWFSCSCTDEAQAKTICQDIVVGLYKINGDSSFSTSLVERIL